MIIYGIFYGARLLVCCFSAWGQRNTQNPPIVAAALAIEILIRQFLHILLDSKIVFDKQSKRKT